MRETQQRGIVLLPIGLHPKITQAQTVHIFHENRLFDIASTEDMDALSQRLLIKTVMIGSSILVLYDSFNTFFVFGSLDISGNKTACFHHDIRLDKYIDKKTLRSCLDTEYGDFEFGPSVPFVFKPIAATETYRTVLGLDAERAALELFVPFIVH